MTDRLLPSIQAKLRHIEILKAKIAAQDNALYQIERADDFCFTNGSYAAAERIRNEYAQELAALEHQLREELAAWTSNQR